jgi:transaldolase
MSERLQALADAGVSIWLDDLSRDRINSGNLADLVANSSVTGVTTNPTIFAAALSKGHLYDDQVRELAATDSDVEDTIKALTTDDVRNACDVFSATYAATNGIDGRVSIEVDPTLAMKTEETIAQALDLWKIVDRPNVLIKIPATKPGLPAITSALAEGASVNVTLIFSLERYRGVIDAYMTGLEQAAANGHDLSRIQSVASFFVSRVDTEVDKRLDAIGSDEAAALKGKAAIANARLAYALYEDEFSGERFAALEAQGAHRQRPLWASTGVKDPAYPDTMYVTDLVVANTVNTMPEKTLQAFADHGEVHGDMVSDTEEEAQQVMDDLAAVGISYDDVVDVLEREGVEKFEASWNELVETVQIALDDAKKGKADPGGNADPEVSDDTVA